MLCFSMLEVVGYVVHLFERVKREASILTEEVSKRRVCTDHPLSSVLVEVILRSRRPHTLWPDSIEQSTAAVGGPQAGRCLLLLVWALWNFVLLNCLVFLLHNNVLFLLPFLKVGPGHGIKEEKLSSSAAQKITKPNWELSLQAETSRHQQVSNKHVHS